MSSGSISSQTQLSQPNSSKTSLSLTQHSHIIDSKNFNNTNSISTPTITKTTTETDMISKDNNRKKLLWKKKDKVQLQLHLSGKQNVNQFNTGGSCIKSNKNNTIIVTTPVISPLRLQKPVKSSIYSNFQSPFKNESISLSAKYAVQFLPAMSITQTSSPVIITASPIITTTTKKKLLQKDSKLAIKQQSNQQMVAYKNDYSNNYIHSGKLPFKYIRNAKQQVEGYPKLQRLYKLKEQQIEKYSTRPYGCRIDSENLSKTLNSWVYDHNLQFDVIMIGALTENQLIYPLLTKLPIDKLCSKPGFLFIWASTKKISELSTLMNDSRTWSKRFRRSEELVFIPVDKNSVYYPKEWSIPEDQILEEVQWHCWMCITGTVRRSTDKDLIHCNVNTDLALENSNTGNSAVPSQIYKVVENFSSSTRRLHIIPTSTGLKKHVKVRPGWVIVSPDVILDNFEPERYKRDIELIGSKIPYNDEIEQLRPKTPS
ncbi:hypothetical protein C6P40_000474 [Pichia californica]|uniref:Karyogamy protein KAR4 n=1 Tax=Pichia californica TaxID=460514 RepID=A0A9P7BH82_9ASCO|nr:hypothetical protein C6P42_001866 [[Candida] californica]KAG0690976.1 hypothetical protein C6P40_000474 [[Candida] californica]